jgi:hypothetical protein
MKEYYDELENKLIAILLCLLSIPIIILLIIISIIN